MFKKVILVLFYLCFFSNCKTKKAVNENEIYVVINSLLSEFNEIKKSLSEETINTLYYKPDFMSMDFIVNNMYERIGKDEKDNFEEQLKAYKNFTYDEEKLKNISLADKENEREIKDSIVINYYVMTPPFFSKDKNDCIISIGERSLFLNNNKINSVSHGFYIHMSKKNDRWKINKKLGQW